MNGASNGKRLTRTTYILGFFLSVHFALLAYINSPFLSEFISEKAVGLVYTVGSLVAAFGFVFIPDILRRYGNFKTTLSFVFLMLAAVSGLVILKQPIVLAALIGAHLFLIRIVSFNSDVFLESASKDSDTGSIRGIYLTISNSAFVMSPLVVGLLLSDDNFRRVYFLSALFLIPVIVLLINKFKNFEDPKYDRVPFWRTFAEVVRRKNVYKVVAANFLLRFFYAWMVIYTPIYLRNHIGFEWSEIGFMFTIMLLPFVLFEFPLGRLADTRFGEKELMTGGFIIIAITTAALSFIGGADFIVWAGALFATRVGASTVDIMSETYFFKQIDGTDSNILSFYRMVQPLSYVIAPVLASVILLFLDIKYLFLILGVVMLWGLRYTLTLKDTL